MNIFFTNSAGTEIYNSGNYGAKMTLTLLSPKIGNHGLTQGGLGFFARMMAKTDILIRSKSGTHDNALTDAGEVLSINSDNSDHETTETLRRDPNIKWLNNPHPDTMKDADIVDLLAEAEQMLRTVRMGVNL